MAAKRDPYVVLGLPRNASSEDIKKAFRKLAFQYHPGRNSKEGVTERFKEINEAYEILSDADKRSAYDRHGHNGPENIFGKGFEGVYGGNINDVFEAFFGGTGTKSKQAPQHGSDIHTHISVSFEEAALGTEKVIEIDRTEVCARCRGTRSRPGTQPARCPGCNGTGQIRRAQHSNLGRFINDATCGQCHGEGTLIKDPCPDCKGSGFQKQRRRFAVKIPAGINDKKMIRITGKGDAGYRGGTAGNLYIEISVVKHKFFSRRAKHSG